MVGEEGVERVEQRYALFAERREIAAQAREGVTAALRAEAAGDLLLGFEQAQIALGSVVIEGNRQVVQEGQHLFLPQPQAFEQIARGRGIGRQMQCLAGMPQLPTRLLARLAPQAARARELALEPVGGRWLAAVVAILSEPCLEILYLSQRRRQLLS